MKHKQPVKRGPGMKAGHTLWWCCFAAGMLIVCLSVLPERMQPKEQTDDRGGVAALGQEYEQERESQTVPGNGQAKKSGGHSRPASDGSLSAFTRGVQIGVKLNHDNKVETVPLEWYVRGVVAGEMPADFEMEALKAQAIAARTYVVRKLLHSGQSDEPLVSDTTDDQVYIPLERLDELWTDGKAKEKLARIGQAVEETANLIITYKGEPIQAAFFSTSNGYTENSEDYWGLALPYLRSVASPWDKQLSPRYKDTVELSHSDARRKLGLGQDAGLAMQVISRTDGHRVKEVMIGGKAFTGREVREKLGLRSSAFSWTVSRDHIRITTYGYGHGVGMSQWGANALAKEGKRAADIIAHYYTDVRIEQASKLPQSS
ncbi:stage II sporulation protein D [Paenibacillus tarimensis]|uniref:stage II sporulation protein D n=1 Tax=Paenibacillus tarimensis TaxID=416012 RepID=UPI001F35C484|nr:stage II sporulation protein D [Paenibacillus tarimensis]MCF2944159.1 stage II sporulation protein D [Paenibacillus tarimensis]